MIKLTIHNAAAQPIHMAVPIHRSTMPPIIPMAPAATHQFWAGNRALKMPIAMTIPRIKMPPSSQDSPSGALASIPIRTPHKTASTANNAVAFALIFKRAITAIR